MLLSQAQEKNGEAELACVHGGWAVKMWFMVFFRQQNGRQKNGGFCPMNRPILLSAIRLSDFMVIQDTQTPFATTVSGLSLPTLTVYFPGA